MVVMGVEIGPKVMAYAQTYDNDQIMGAKKKTSEASKMTRSTRSAEKSAKNDAYEKTEGLLYAPGTSDYYKYTFFL